MSARTMREDWETPPSIFDPLHAEFGFTVDGAARYENAKCPRFWHDSLDLDWSGERVWLNPPYGHKNLRAWIGKAWRESQRGALVVCLVPAHTGQVWWSEFAVKATEIRWIKGKVKFVGAASCAPFPSCLLIYRPALALLGPAGGAANESASETSENIACQYVPQGERISGADVERADHAEYLRKAISPTTSAE